MSVGAALTDRFDRALLYATEFSQDLEWLRREFYEGHFGFIVALSCAGWRERRAQLLMHVLRLPTKLISTSADYIKTWLGLAWTFWCASSRSRAWVRRRISCS